MNSMSDLFREEPIPFVIYNNDLRSKSSIQFSYTHFFHGININRIIPMKMLDNHFPLFLNAH